MKKKRICLLLVLIMIATLFAGCMIMSNGLLSYHRDMTGMELKEIVNMLMWKESKEENFLCSLTKKNLSR